VITFQVTPFFPTNPDYLFMIKGFSTLIEKQVQDLIYNIWHNNNSTTIAQSTINNAPEKDHTTLAFTIQSFLNSLSVTCLNIKEHRGALMPRFNIYACGATILHYTIWLNICKYLANRIYFTLMHG